MTSEARRVLPGIEIEPHHCFACGELNEHGLHLELHASTAGCWTELAIEPRFQGWDSVAHGGIVTTLLDEVMAWSVIGRGAWGVTARLNVSFRKPIPIGTAIRAEGHVVEDRRRLFRTEGRVIDVASGGVLAEAEGTFIAAPPDQLEVLKRRYRMRRVEAPLDADLASDPVAAPDSSEFDLTAPDLTEPVDTRASS